MPPSASHALVFDVQRLSVHDGPGVRTTVFFKGCPLRCAWCHNPESVQAVPELLLHPANCLACGACATVCPVGGAWDPAANRPARPDDCRGCGACADLCPAEARRLAGRWMDVDAIVAAALRDRPFYGAKGGVTFGGGEPLAQWPAVRAAAAALRAAGVHLALDTCGMGPDEAVAAAPELFDLLLLDLKLASPAAHQRWTGAANDRVLAVLERWSRAAAGRLWVSVPYVPEVHGPGELTRLATLLRDLPGPPPVRLLPYHRLGEGKHAALGLPVPAFTVPSAGQTAAARGAFLAAGLTLLT